MLLENGMKVVEIVLKRLLTIVTASEMQIGLMSERGTIGAMFIVRRMRWMKNDDEGCKKSIMLKKKSCMCALWT